PPPVYSGRHPLRRRISADRPRPSRGSVLPESGTGSCTITFQGLGKSRPCYQHGRASASSTAARTLLWWRPFPPHLLLGGGIFMTPTRQLASPLVPRRSGTP